MPSKIQRPYTSYEMKGYDIYPSDVYEDDYNPYVDARSPTPQDLPSGRYGANTPGAGGRETPCRPASRINHGTQTESRLGYNNAEAERRRYMPLQREMTMPARPELERRRYMSLHSDARPEQDLDPITRQYYNRLFLRSQSPDVNLYRQGRAGGRWRHVTSCYSNTGSHMSFVEGTVKQVDNNLLLPRRPDMQKPNLNGATYPKTVHRATSASKRKPKNSVFYDHAKNGFRYWYQEQNKPMDPASSFRITGESDKDSCETYVI